ncbi:hypothetical protein M409DRAFT_52500 [Zasmidium cellare ATCC 36951]|uniref:Uncharacterized protein n=1 Tax=Zasmidium cellare ATCC 36951 TaxID=1080233 RepID=A0A6A6CSU4_ZASCE|nr:uncharacterized protein M409DRAFT_52500 [Zasmidium cellare ATCC 36951]KAF2169230.1 hypothetical protein M409DRAFT_52500 [Zasmidium cellare ATCC 36951]
MAIPQNTDVPTYVVYRDTPAGEPFDPTSPLLFFPPKGSDELFDALRIAFPNVKTHSERMRDAMIQYLLQERQDEQLASPAVTMDTMPTNTWPSMSSDSNSTWSSPELLNFPTPEASFSNSPQLAPQLSRQTSIATSSRASPTGPSIDQMTNVFCLSTSSQPKQRIRRKMTDAEKAEYRKRRIVKACDKCAKRKRKCPHNQAEMAQVPNKSHNRTAKPSSKSTTPINDSQTQKMALDSATTFDELANSFDPNEFIDFNDFNMFEESYAELDMNDMINWNQNELFTLDVSPLQRDWSYGSQADDFTMLDPRATHQVEFNNMSFTTGETHGDTLYNHSSDSRGEQQSFDNLQTFAHFEDVHALAKAGGLDRQGNNEHAQHLRNSGGTNGGGTATNGSGNQMLWEHLRTGQPEPQPEKPVPTHTAHVHAADSIGLHSLDEPIAQSLETNQRTLPQTVLRLTSTAKAVTVLLRLLGNRSQECSSVTVDRIVHLLRDRDLQTDAHLQQHRRRQVSNMPAHLQRALFQESALDDGRKRATAHPEEVHLTRSDLVREKSGSRRLVLSLLGESATPLTSTSVSVSCGARKSPAAAAQGRPQDLLQQQSSAERDAVQTEVRSSLPRRPQTSLGEGIPADANAASDLYMARRRISPRLNRWTDVNTSPSVNASIPGTDQLCISATSKTATQNQARAQNAAFGQEQLNTDVRPSRSTPTPQPNGGAYLRVGQEAASPVHTRPRNPTASGFSGDTDDHHGAGNTNLATVSRVASSLAQAVASGLQAHEARLSCHNTYRDHHGRSALATLSWIAVLGALFMATAMVGISPSVALLALVYPLSAAEELEGTTSRQQKPVRCSRKNSSWLSTYASMQVGSAKSSSRGRGNEKEKLPHSAWVLRPEPDRAVLQVVGGA